MKRLTCYLFAATLLLSTGGRIRVEDSYNLGQFRNQAPIEQAFSPARAYAKELKKEAHPEPDLSKTINGKPAHFYNFDLSDLELGVLLKKEPRQAGYYLSHLSAQYGNRLEFIVAAGFYSMGDNNSVGEVYVRGERKARGMYGGGAYIVCRDGKPHISIRLKTGELEKADWAHGGFGRLVLNHRLDLKETRTRRARSLGYWDSRPRAAFVIYDNSRAGLAFYTGTVHSFAHGLKALGIKDAVLLDSGNSRFMAYQDSSHKPKTFKRDNPQRRIKSVIHGVKKTKAGSTPSNQL